MVSLSSIPTAEQSPLAGGDVVRIGPAPRPHPWTQPAIDFCFTPNARGSDRLPGPDSEAAFRADFLHDLARLATWAAQHNWAPRAVRHLQVIVSDRYRISRSLVPSWYGDAGRMEFPIARVAARKAAIAHELVHVFFPNGSRLLAEGLAIYLQDRIGGNPAFPNFGRPLHAHAHDVMRRMTAGMTPDAARPFAAVDLAALDAIATPNPLTLRVGAQFYGEDARGQGQVYPLAGSFVAFLIETRGLAAFRALYRETPFTPLVLNGGAPERWRDRYGVALAELEQEWKLQLCADADAAAALQQGA